MTALENLARKACHYKHCLSTDKEIDGLCCGKIVSAMQEAVTNERMACAELARTHGEGWTATDDGREGLQGMLDAAEEIADKIEERDDDAPPGPEPLWLRQLRAERDVSLFLHCEWSLLDKPPEGMKPCEHCGLCLSAINMAVEVWSVDKAEQAVEDAPMGCVACHRSITMTHLDGLIGHNLPAFKPCPVKQADL